MAGWAVTAAAAWLMVLACLSAWSLLPMATGWHPSVVLTGSMEPLVNPGDVILVDPSLRSVHVGEIVVVRDPTVPSGRVSHRVVRLNSDGTFVTRGDNNPSEDSAVRTRSDVVGEVRLVVPAAGRLVMLTRAPSTGDLLWAGVSVVAALVLLLPRGPRVAVAAHRA